MGMGEGNGPVRVVLDLERGAEPISGTIATDAGSARPFSGLMQLVAALDGVREGQATDGKDGARSKGNQ